MKSLSSLRAMNVSLPLEGKLVLEDGSHPGLDLPVERRDGQTV
jgi:hypothetical protein